VLVILGIAVYQNQKKISSFQMAPNILEERLEMRKENGGIDLKNIGM